MHDGPVAAGERGLAPRGAGLADGAAGGASDHALSVAYRDGRLTVWCTNAALDDLFARVEVATGIRVLRQRVAARTCRRTRIDDRPLDWALDRLLTDHGLSYVLVLDREEDIVTLRIFGGGETVRRAPPRPARTPGFLRRWRHPR
jgi:hypothetical protein